MGENQIIGTSMFMCACSYVVTGGAGQPMYAASVVQ
eukprot:CAMPEP_0174971828 /NCGR_PEP_ID=MMETSP0004_2-20121128/10252_1 /TAXON_ID=420556 /ORGANISM="Ochromonas sp., Strain CCMP1393" /LENGTH=35 /DNA_ID= /DNA_START= /DNA_END= /DNA_ORIENTATION=